MVDGKIFSVLRLLFWRYWNITIRVTDTEELKGN